MRGFERISEATSYFFLRHGESDGNISGIFQGRGEYPLSEVGERHAESAGRWLRGRPIDMVISSPLERSYRTAAIVARVAGLPDPVRDELLTEIDTGSFTGLSASEIQGTYPDDWRRFKELSWEGVPGAETVAQLAERANIYWQKLIALSEDGRRGILTVTHSGLLQWILKVSMGAERSWMPLFSISNCGLFQLYVAPPHRSGTAARHMQDSYYAQWRLMNLVPYEG